MNASQHQSSTHQQSGFTLTELMITIAIGAILAAVAIPNFSGYVGNSRIVAQTNEIIGTVNRARSEAMKRNELVIVCPSKVDRTDPEKSTCRLGDAGEYNLGWLTYVNERIDPEAFALPEPDNYEDGKDHLELLAVQFGEDAGKLTMKGSKYGLNYFGFAPDGSLRSFNSDGSSVPVNDLIGDAVNIAVCDERGEDFGRLIQILHTGRTRIRRPEDGVVTCTPE